MLKNSIIKYLINIFIILLLMANINKADLSESSIADAEVEYYPELIERLYGEWVSKDFMKVDCSNCGEVGAPTEPLKMTINEDMFVYPNGSEAIGITYDIVGHKDFQERSQSTEYNNGNNGCGEFSFYLYIGPRLVNIYCLESLEIGTISYIDTERGGRVIFKKLE